VQSKHCASTSSCSGKKNSKKSMFKPNQLKKMKPYLLFHGD